jgi:hypothetical protein
MYVFHFHLYHNCFLWSVQAYFMQIDGTLNKLTTVSSFDIFIPWNEFAQLFLSLYLARFCKLIISWENTLMIQRITLISRYFVSHKFWTFIIFTNLVLFQLLIRLTCYCSLITTVISWFRYHNSFSYFFQVDLFSSLKTMI